MRVLVVEDHEPTRRLMRRMLLELEGVIVDEASTAAEALSALAANSPELMLLDVRLGSGAETGGLEVLRDARALGCKARAVMVTGDLGSVREAMRLGASDYVLKGELSIDVLSAIVAEVQRHSLRPPPPTDDRRRARSLLGRSHGIERLRRLITQIAQAHAPVLVYGETGSGKELVARALHEEGSHADEPFVAINCSAIPASLFESVLFGHERGAFTGAERRTRGQLLVAAHGTVLLDEIAEMPLDIQAKLLRVLEERTVLPLGAEREIPFSARVVAATHVDLAERVEKGLFRRDLYYRLNVLYIDVPPLASRVEDIPELVATFARQAERPLQLTPDALDWLAARPWPGNVRELKNLVERVALLAPTSHVDAKTLMHLAGAPSGTHAIGEIQRLASKLASLPGPLTSKLDAVERMVLKDALLVAGNNKSEAARMLGMDRKVLERRFHRLGLGIADDHEDETKEKG